jgi:hypothetical protein
MLGPPSDSRTSFHVASKDNKSRIHRISKWAEGAVAVTLACGLLAGCATAPPVQEMSDARQAIAAAEEASADERAPDTLNEARRFLETAEDLLRQEAYGAARINAVRAKNRAVQALEASQLAEPTDAE